MEDEVKQDHAEQLTTLARHSRAIAGGHR